MSDIFEPVSVTKHLDRDSRCPEKNPQILRLYSQKFCPYAQRIRLILAAKKIKNEVVNINLKKKPDWYYTINPLGKVPCLEIEGNKVVYESLIIAEYLDEIHSDRQLRSSDPYQKAQDRIHLDFFSRVTLFMSNLYRFQVDNESAWKENLAGLQTSLDRYEQELEKRATPFFSGKEPGMLDYMMWPWFERIPLLSILTLGVVTVQMSAKFPKLAEWCDRMTQDPAVQESYISPNNHCRYIKDNLTGCVDYDMELV